MLYIGLNIWKWIISANLNGLGSLLNVKENFLCAHNIWHTSIHGTVEEMEQTTGQLYKESRMMKTPDLYVKVLFIAAVLAIVNENEEVARFVVISELGYQCHETQITFNLFGFKQRKASQTELQDQLTLFHVVPNTEGELSEVRLEIKGLSLFECCEWFGSSFLYAELRRKLYPVKFEDISGPMDEVKEDFRFQNLVKYADIPKHDGLLTYRMNHENKLFVEKVEQVDKIDFKNEQKQAVKFLCRCVFALHSHYVDHGNVTFESIVEVNGKWKTLTGDSDVQSYNSDSFESNSYEDIDKLQHLLSDAGFPDFECHFASDALRHFALLELERPCEAMEGFFNEDGQDMSFVANLDQFILEATRMQEEIAGIQESEQKIDEKLFSKLQAILQNLEKYSIGYEAPHVAATKQDASVQLEEALKVAKLARMGQSFVF
eukprot:TRINITY_DN11798_c0_g1_i4.p1 TRINITY_DN11798_c0_g1~~TRINITY_DN11798_c0_g1_i4.p1  ORF type:complete len:433 (-),score=114.37 TRINITY_DN11798_c0_g1_i4:100-1398(-)